MEPHTNSTECFSSVKYVYHGFYANLSQKYYGKMSGQIRIKFAVLCDAVKK